VYEPFRKVLTDQASQQPDHFYPHFFKVINETATD